MSHDTFIGLPGLTAELAATLDRQADLEGAPFRFTTGRPAGRRRRPEPPGVMLVALRDDPSLASETLDSEHRWPQDPAVRDWLIRAAAFLGRHAPEGTFSLFSGWIEHRAESTVTLTLDEFIECIREGRLRSDEQYEVRATSR